ncbi:MAG: hypothetical protein HWD60_08475 [Defluviicoccus sp.]|nr:MAG: hypothetical protein HWD60_08475 [Defluviicoccus sp.]
MGDISRVDSEGNIALSVQCGNGGNGNIEVYDTSRSGGNGGSNARITTFSDTLTGSNGDDWLVGDLHQTGSSGGVSATVEVGTGGDDDDLPAGSGGNNNVVTAFSDVLQGGAGNDTLIGDHSAVSTQVFYYRPEIYVGTDGDGGAAGGTGNVVSAFCDTLIGGNGDDLLVGDVLGTGASQAEIEGGNDNTISAFRDILLGGVGNDSLFGDAGEDSTVSSNLISSDFEGRDFVFADTLLGGNGDDLLSGGRGTDLMLGGAGDDMLDGGMGVDQMSGGAGSDRFSWMRNDVRQYDGGKLISVVDEITDFSLDDVLDFTKFSASSYSFTAEDITLRSDSGDTIISVSLPSSSGDMVVLSDFTTTLSVEELVDDGVILIA